LIPNNFKELYYRYFERNRHVINAEDEVCRMNGVILHRTSDALFDVWGILVEEVRDFCSQRGYEVDKVVFLCNYENSYHENREITKEDNVITVESKTQLESDSEISIVREGNLIIARVFVGSHVGIGKHV